MAGQQFEYSFDDIGNRQTAASGGDAGGASLRLASYSANNLNQYTQRTVPGYAEVQGTATNFATVTANLQPTYRKGEYFRGELGVDNSSDPVWLAITNVAVLTNGGGPNIVSTNQGNLLVAKATEAFLHDLDGNLISDSLWTNVWNGENRLIATESASGVPSAGKAKETWSHLPDGRWIERVISTWNGSAYVAHTTNRFVWDGQILLAIVDHTNGLVTSFARGLDLSGSLQGAGGVGGVLAVNIATNGVHFAAFDGNGNVSALVSATNGAVTANYEYSPFGETLRANGVVAKSNPIRFSTQFADDVTGDNKWKYREERPSWGGWLSRDPIGEQGGLNIYVLNQNDSIGRVDALGRFSLGDHGELTRGSFNAAVKVSGVKASAKCLEKILDNLVSANRQQDWFHFSSLQRHYNRGKSQDKLGADKSYAKYLKDEADKYAEAGEEISSKKGCKQATKALGHLTHAWQDFFAHAIRRDGEGGFEFGSDSDEEGWLAWTQGVTGTPDSRGNFWPSSYSFFGGGEHPNNGEPLVKGGAEYYARKAAAAIYVQQQLSSHLPDLLKKCDCKCDDGASQE